VRGGTLEPQSVLLPLGISHRDAPARRTRSQGFRVVAEIEAK
jgi:hypothetical protein